MPTSLSLVTQPLSPDQTLLPKSPMRRSIAIEKPIMHRMSDDERDEMLADIQSLRAANEALQMALDLKVRNGNDDIYRLYLKELVGLGWARLGLGCA